MRPPSTPTGNNGNSQRTRTRGAIRTHLGRKRMGPRNRLLQHSTLDNISEVTGADRRRQEEMFERMSAEFQHFIRQAGETTDTSFESALAAACEGLVAAGELTAENGERLREYLRRDLLHRDNPALTFRSGDITGAGTLSCAGCGWTIIAARATLLPPCPYCLETAYRKTA
jgi:Zinc-ribbon containing domain